MLRQRSSEVMLCSARRTRRLPDNWLSSQLVIFAHDNVASVQTVGENCIVNMANRLTDEDCKYGAKKQRKLRGGGCNLYSVANGQGHSPEFGPSTKVQQRRRAYCVACNKNFGIWATVKLGDTLAFLVKPCCSC